MNKEIYQRNFKFLPDFGSLVTNELFLQDVQEFNIMIFDLKEGEALHPS